MCFVDKDMPTEFPPLGAHDIPHVFGAVVLAIAAVLILLAIAPMQQSHWTAVRRLTVASNAAVEPHIWR